MDYGSQVLTSSSTGISPVTKQTCYEGSSRQIRGAVIRVLTTSDELELQVLKASLDCEVEESELRGIIDRLIADGLVKSVDNEKFKIVD
jgi:hypothetical protein